MPSMTAPRDWTVAQHFAIWIGLFTTVTGLIGLAINPDFAVGDDATAASFIVDWKGWHAVAAILVGVPGLAIAWFPDSRSHISSTARLPTRALGFGPCSTIGRWACSSFPRAETRSCTW